MPTYHIKNRESLLQNIAAGLNQHDHVQLCCLEIKFLQDGEVVLATSVATALDYLANDIYFNEESDWSNAEIAEVHTM